MPGPLEHSVLVRPGEHQRVMGGTAVDAISVAVDRDSWHRDWWLRDETRFDVGHGRIAGNEAEAVSIGVDDDVYKVGVVECGGRAFESRVVERPTRGPHLPEQPRDLAAVLRKPAAPAFGVEIVLIPHRCFSLGARRLKRSGNVLNVVGIA